MWWPVFNVLLPLFRLFLVFLCYFLNITNFWERKWTQKSNQYCEHSAVTNSSILISRTLCFMLLCALVVLLIQMKERLPAGTCLCISTWMRGISSPDCVDFTGIELDVVKPEPVICICDNNVVCIPPLSGKWRDEKNWHSSGVENRLPFCFWV